MGLQHLVVHGNMLLDGTRNAALAKAIDEVVSPGDVVADVGAGTGLLAMLAARAGADHVYALERGPMAQLASRLVRRNGLADIVEVLTQDSRTFTPARPVDVVLCETLGMAVLDEGFRDTMTDARDRYLRPGGVLVPAQVDVLVAPVRRTASTRSLDDLDVILGLDFSSFGELVRRVHRRAHVADGDLLAPPATAFSLDCSTMPPGGELSSQVVFEPFDADQLGGLVLWFEAHLSPAVSLSNWGADVRNHWGQALLPVRTRSSAVAGVRLWVDDRPGHYSIRWRLVDGSRP